ncbi:MAG: TonB-dependent receptor, partial [Gemmatimonadetes bacterium]|nr:TonB-dependent receptor [Gemmatimonadota bacterium]
MRALHFISYWSLGRRAALACVLTLLALDAFHPRGAWAQWPGQIHGSVTDAVTGAPVSQVAVQLPDLSRTATSDPAGTFRFRGVDPGVHRLVVARLGYAPAEILVSVDNGAIARVRLVMTPAPVGIEGLGVRLDRAVVPGAYSISPREIRAAGASTLGDLLRGRPGVTVSERGVGGAQTVSIRGVAPDGVLVLVDGVPLNDPVTGEADVSRLAASSTEQITVLPGARTARFGPRAQGGVVLVRTREAGSRPSLRAEGGSLGSWRGSAGWGASVGGFRIGAGGEASGSDGGFTFTQPAEVGGGETRRSNADVERWTGWVTANGSMAEGLLRMRLGSERIERGLPGKSFAPSPSARQTATRSQGSIAWRRVEPGLDLGATLFGTLGEARFEDPDPALGLPFDTRTRLSSGGLKADMTRRWPGAWRPEVGGGLDGEYQRVNSGALSERAPRERAETSAYLHGAVTLPFGSAAPTVSLAVRAHRDGLSGAWRATHEVGVTWTRGPVSLQFTQRSAFSPPSLGDQYFREGVAVVPNPDLGPERVPSEWEAGVAFAGGRAVGLSGGLSAFRGDIAGMIVWQPDFRFVWSPRNIDVRRDGLEAWFGADARLRGGGALKLKAEYSLVRVTYDRDDPEPVQILYRPRHTAAVRADLEVGAWSGGGSAHYLGARFPVPSPVNELPGFWSIDLAVHRSWRWAGGRVRTGLRVD